MSYMETSGWEKCKKRLLMWKGQHLSLGDWVSFVDFCFKIVYLYFIYLSTRLCKKKLHQLIIIQWHFVSGGDEAHRKIFRVSWSDACKSKQEGDLELRIWKLSTSHFWVSGSGACYLIVRPYSLIYYLTCMALQKLRFYVMMLCTVVLLHREKS